MTIHIDLPPRLEQKLRDRAAAAGIDAGAFALQVLEEKLENPHSLAEILAPLHAESQRDPISEDDLDHMIDECRDEDPGKGSQIFSADPGKGSQIFSACDHPTHACQ